MSGRSCRHTVRPGWRIRLHPRLSGSSDEIYYAHTTEDENKEVAYHITDIFSIFGASLILQSDNGKEFINKVISEVSQLWPGLKFVRGKPKHSQNQRYLERLNQDVRDMTIA